MDIAGAGVPTLLQAVQASRRAPPAVSARRLHRHARLVALAAQAVGGVRRAVGGTRGEGPVRLRGVGGGLGVRRVAVHIVARLKIHNIYILIFQTENR